MSELMSSDESLYPLRLQKFLARSGIASRRGSEDLMTAGRVKVNGEVMRELGCKVDPRVDMVCVDDIEVRPFGKSVTLMLNKPCGYITTMTDPYNRPCVAELIPTQRYPGLFPIGRLDCDTSGLLLFSTDGDLGNKLLHPSFHVTKYYEVHACGYITQDELTTLAHGVLLDDGMTAPAQVELIEYQNDLSFVRIGIHEGRKRQVKRMFSAVGHPVERLHRAQFGPLSLGDLKPKDWRIVSDAELLALRTSAHLE